MIVTIKENSWLAKIAAKKLKTRKVAMVIGRTIHLFGCDKQEFLSNKDWLRHEIAHVNQWKKFGLLRFSLLYLFESILKGYYNNRYEVEARSKERDAFILNDVDIR